NRDAHSQFIIYVTNLLTKEIKMNKDIFEGKWEEVKGKMKQTWGKLTDDDFKQIEGAHQEIYGKLQKHYGYSKEEAEKMVQEFQDK
ncbi:TPA: CsbD family protein, partial [Legionella pneumophila]